MLSILYLCAFVNVSTVKSVPLISITTCASVSVVVVKAGGIGVALVSSFLTLVDVGTEFLSIFVGFLVPSPVAGALVSSVSICTS